MLGGAGNPRSTAMSNKSNPTIATMGIDIGKNSFHVVGLIDARPQSRQIDETSCDARPDHTYGSKAAVPIAWPRVRRADVVATVNHPDRGSLSTHDKPARANVQGSPWAELLKPAPDDRIRESLLPYCLGLGGAHRSHRRHWRFRASASHGPGPLRSAAPIRSLPYSPSRKIRTSWRRQG